MMIGTVRLSIQLIFHFFSLFIKSWIKRQSMDSSFLSLPPVDGQASVEEESIRKSSSDESLTAWHERKETEELARQLLRT